MQYSVIIPTFNRQKVIQALLGVLQDEWRGRSDVEVLVVDDGSSPPVLVPDGFRLIRQSNQGPAAARNAGAAQARGEYLLFLDDDCEPSPGWIDAFGNLARSGVLLAGQVQNACPDNPQACFNQHLTESLAKLTQGTENHFVTSNNICAPAKDFREIGGFSTQFPLAAGEDREFCERWLRSGRQIEAAPDAVIQHRHPQNLVGFARMHFRYGRGARVLRDMRPQPSTGLNPLLLAKEVGWPHLFLYLLSQLSVALGFYRNEAKSMLRYTAISLAGVISLLGWFWQCGAFRAGFGGADEAAHLVSGIMIRQYLLEGLPHGVDPMAFAQNYYDHYPKVAIGHWPPFFYVLQAFWYLIFGLSRFSVLALAAVIGGAFCGLTAWLCRTLVQSTWPVAVAAALCAVLLPQFLSSSVEFSSDPLTALLALLAAIFCQRWLRDLQPGWGLAFACCAAMAALTKGNSFPVFLLPGLVLFHPQRFERLLSIRFWLPLVILIALTAPWYMLFREIVQGEIVPGKTVSLPGRMFHSSRSNGMQLFFLAGPLLGSLSVLTLFLPRARRRLLDHPAIAALPFAFWFFLSFLSPHTETRLMLAAAPILVVSALLPFRQSSAKLTCAVLLAGLAIAHWYSPVYAKPRDQYLEAVAWAQANPVASTLLISNSNGEGAWISEYALQQPSPQNRHLRASKLLLSSNWMGDRVRLLVNHPAELAAKLEENSVDRIVLMLDSNRPALLYAEALTETLKSWKEETQFGSIQVLRRNSQ